MKEEILFKTSMGDVVSRRDESIIITFNGKRNVVSTSNLNGGYREDLKYIYNNSCGRNPLIKKKICPGLKGKTLEEHYAVIAEELGLPAEVTTGIGTAALMENVAIVTKTYDKLTVTAIATGGIDVNGGSAGDLARYNEFTGEAINQINGTINIIVLIDAKLSAGVLTRAQMTATEAKSAVLRELAAPSMYSEEPATGSGTDALITMANLESDLVLHGAGKHSISGQLIGQCVKEALKEALDKQCSMNPKRQASMIWQGKRYGLTEESLYEAYVKEQSTEPLSFESFKKTLLETTSDNVAVAYIVPIFHLIDQHRWRMISLDSLNQVALNLLNQYRAYEGLDLFVRSRFENYKELLKAVKESILLATSRRLK